MRIHLPRITDAKQALQQSLKISKAMASDVPKGHFAIYVGEYRKRFVIPVSYLNHSLFQDLLHEAEEEYGFDQPMGRLRVPCSEDAFITLISHMNGS
ncbi:auxin-induced protein 15A-like [Phoenix dactylifera]|uniref:Auxin-induced protein 15A-like n=1 Tax=Phoenix dactylifera TaxID=42345 RepID=A0A8B7BKW5_PHODC|nr:auxin-induced protein 15A-like [Phoenix dactylifera]